MMFLFTAAFCSVLTVASAEQIDYQPQIDSYTKGQQDSLRFAFSQQDPSRSLAIIRTNFDTLAKGFKRTSGTSTMPTFGSMVQKG